MRAIRVENAGPDYRLVTAELPMPAPAAGEVLIKVAAAGLNRADIAQALGSYPPPPGAPDTLGMEVSGTVEAVGTGVSTLRKGDAVCALIPGGGYADYAVAPAVCTLPIPKGVEPVAAAGLPEVHFTVWTNLMDSARLAPGESVLIHGGSSGIGTAAIQLCAARGHRVFATAGSAAKCKACTELGATRAINYREEDFVDVTREATNGTGVDVILDMVGGSYIERNFRAAARGGRIVNIAFQGGMKAEVNFGLDAHETAEPDGDDAARPQPVGEGRHPRCRAAGSLASGRIRPHQARDRPDLSAGRSPGGPCADGGQRPHR